MKITKRLNYLLYLGLLTYLLTVISCSQPVIYRDSRGMVLNQPYQQNGLGGAGAAAESIKKKVSLLTFFNESPFGGQDLEIFATEELRNELLRTGDFIFEDVAASPLSSSKEVYAAGGFKLNQVARQAKLAGLNFVIYGRIIESRVRQKSDEIGIVRKMKSFTETKMEIKIYDVHANKEIFSTISDGTAHDGHYQFFAQEREDQLSYRQELLRYSMRVAIRRALPKIIEISSRLDWVGRVAKIIGTKIYINAGRRSGIQVGDVLKVMTEGQEIFDPETGAMIGTAQGEVKGTLEIIDFFGPDGTIAILHSGGAVMEGDYVQLY